MFERINLQENWDPLKTQDGKSKPGREIQLETQIKKIYENGQ